jgi:hypothetical protein
MHRLRDGVARLGGPRRLVALAVAALAVYVTIGIILAGRDAPQIPPQRPMQLYGGHVAGKRISTTSWSFDYRHAQLSPDGTIATIDGVRNGIVFRDGHPYLRIAAEHITANTQSLDFTAVGRVRIERPGTNGARIFETDEVIWSNATQLLQLPHPCYYRTGNDVLKIAGATVDFKKGTVHLGKIEGTVNAAP